MDVIQFIEDAFDWSNNKPVERPKHGWQEVRSHPDLISLTKIMLKRRNLQGEELEIFYWWMGVVLNLVPSQLK